MRWDGKSPSLPSSELLQRGFGILGFGAGFMLPDSKPTMVESLVSLTLQGTVCQLGCAAGGSCPKGVVATGVPPKGTGLQILVAHHSSPCAIYDSRDGGHGAIGSPASCLAPSFHLVSQSPLQSSPSWNDETRAWKRQVVKLRSQAWCAPWQKPHRERV